MADHQTLNTAADEHQSMPHGGEAGAEIHLPPNSWVPISVALSLMVSFVGFLIPSPGNIVTVAVGLIWLVASLVQWARAGRSEYLELH